MKHLFFPLLLSAAVLPVTRQLDLPQRSINLTEASKAGNEINLQDGQGFGRMSSIVFKSQDYCRAELEDFEFDVHFSIVSATVYFSGAGFKSIERGYLSSNSFKPIKQLMERCMPGTIVVFDDVKVKGPDNKISMIQGLSLTLY